MPELPEVETTRRGVWPYIRDRKIIDCVVHQPSLRWPVPDNFAHELLGRQVKGLTRRAKYLVFELDNGLGFLMHLGMSGSLRLTEPIQALRKHDHLLMTLDSGRQLRFHDPRRFGCVLWLDGLPAAHALLNHLGPEPLGDSFTAAYLHGKAKGRKVPIKNFIMDAAVVVGVGNIYASEALYRAGIHPKRAAGRISLTRMERLVTAVRAVLVESIAQGGTTLRDFLNESGEPGYFKQSLSVYGKAGQPCLTCGSEISAVRLGQRSTFFCPNCQR
jgi:formamidopyrimidine-DNA glycosylase